MPCGFSPVSTTIGRLKRMRIGVNVPKPSNAVSCDAILVPSARAALYLLAGGMREVEIGGRQRDMSGGIEEAVAGKGIVSGRSRPG